SSTVSQSSPVLGAKRATGTGRRRRIESAGSQAEAFRIDSTDKIAIRAPKDTKKARREKGDRVALGDCSPRGGKRGRSAFWPDTWRSADSHARETGVQRNRYSRNRSSFFTHAEIGVLSARNSSLWQEDVELY